MKLDPYNVKVYLAISLIYLFTAFLMYPNIVTHPTTLIPLNNSDGYELLWDLWWSGHALLSLHSNVYTYTSSIFYPVGVNTVYEVLSPITAMLSLPFQIFGLTLAYNSMFFLGFVFSGLCGFVLCKQITKNDIAAFLGGFFFTFSAFHILFGRSLDFFNIGTLALFVYFILRGAETNWRYRYAVLSGLSFVLIVFMDEIEEGLFAITIVFLIVMFYMTQNELRRKILSKDFLKFSGVAVISAFVLGSWGFIPIIAAITSQNGLGPVTSFSTIYDNSQFSANLWSFFLPNYYFYGNGLQGTTPNILAYAAGSTGNVYLGYTVIALAAYGVYKDRKRASMWLFIGLVAIWLSLGPYLHIGSVTSFSNGLPGLFLLYRLIPGFEIIREPQRLDLIASLAFSVLAAIGATYVFERIKTIGEDATLYSYVLAALICLIFFMETYGVPVGLSNGLFGNTYIPPFISSISTIPGNFSVLMLPSTLNAMNYRYNGLAEYYQTAALKPLIGGATSRETTQDELTVFSVPLLENATFLATYNSQVYYSPPYVSPINDNYTLQSLKTLSDYNTGFVVMENSAYSSYGFDMTYTMLNRTFGEPVYADQNITVFSTSKALRGNLYREFIGYYAPDHWREFEIPLNGMNTTWWSPINTYGVVIAYAPYNSSGQSGTYMNATMSFQAFSASQQVLYIQNYPQVDNPQHFNSSLDIGTVPQTYNVKIKLIRGQDGNIVGFFDRYLENQNLSDMVFINNITFSN